MIELQNQVIPQRLHSWYTVPHGRNGPLSMHHPLLVYPSKEATECGRVPRVFGSLRVTSNGRMLHSPHACMRISPDTNCGDFHMLVA